MEPFHTSLVNGSGTSGLSTGWQIGLYRRARETYINSGLMVEKNITKKLLEVTPNENGQSLLNSTLVVHVTDMGDGRDHTGENAPYFIAGGRKLFRYGLVMDVQRATQ